MYCDDDNDVELNAPSDDIFLISSSLCSSTSISDFADRLLVLFFFFCRSTDAADVAAAVVVVVSLATTCVRSSVIYVTKNMYVCPLSFI